MAPLQKSLLDQAIDKYGGADDAYKNKLKQTIAEGLGYSNYMSKLNKAVNAPVNTGDVSGMDPETIAANRASQGRMWQGQVEHYAGITGAIDTAAESLASKKAAEAKTAATAAENAQGTANGVAFQPKDALDQKILEMMQNNRIKGGKYMSVDDIRQQLYAENSKNMYNQGTDKMFDPNTGNFIITATPNYVYGSTEEINKRIAERIPADYSGNEDKYYLLSQGYSRKEADTYAGASRYNEMSEPEKVQYGVRNPAMAKFLEANVEGQQAVSDAGEVETEKFNNQTATKPKYTFTQLKEKYKGIDEKSLKEQVAPQYAVHVNDEIKTEISKFKGKISTGDEFNGYDLFKAIYNKMDTSEKFSFGGMTSVKKTNTYNEMYDILERNYGDIFTRNELVKLLDDNILSNIR